MIDQFPDTKKMVQPTDRQIDRLFWQCEQNPQEYRKLIRKFFARFGGPAITHWSNSMINKTSWL
jgi:hypothetical protein